MHRCRYSYRDGFCASGAVSGMHCVGQEACPVHNPGLRRSVGKHRMLVTVGEETLTEKCLRWSGLYCPQYKMFYCASEGECWTCNISPRDYMESFHTFKGGAGGRR
ncbi:MAG: hypothetical protein AB1665_05465 [Candidatus Thermoplasmatota archaeon]